jgi:hypothetical protein
MSAAKIKPESLERALGYLDAASNTSDPGLKVKVLGEIASVLMQLKRPDRVLKLAREIMSMEERSAEVLLKVSELLAECGEIQEAISMLEEAVSRGGGRVALRRLGELASQDERYYRRAIVAWREFLRYEPSDLQALGVLAGLYEIMGDSKRSVAYQAVRQFFESRENLNRPAPNIGPLTPSRRVRALLPEAKGHLGRILELLASKGISIIPQTSKVGSTPLYPDGPEKIKRAYERARYVLGPEEIQEPMVYTIAGQDTEILGEPSLPPVIFIQGGVEEISQREAIFLITRALVSLRTGETIVELLSQKQVLGMLNLLKGILSGEEIKGNKNLKQCIERLSINERAILSAALDHVLNPLFEKDLPKVIFSLRLAVSRIALAATGDLEAALWGVVRIECRRLGIPFERPNLCKELILKSEELRGLYEFGLEGTYLE